MYCTVHTSPCIPFRVSFALCVTNSKMQAVRQCACRNTLTHRRGTHPVKKLRIRRQFGFFPRPKNLLVKLKVCAHIGSHDLIHLSEAYLLTQHSFHLFDMARVNRLITAQSSKIFRLRFVFFKFVQKYFVHLPRFKFSERNFGMTISKIYAQNVGDMNEAREISNNGKSHSAFLIEFICSQQSFPHNLEIDMWGISVNHKTAHKVNPVAKTCGSNTIHYFP